MIAERAGAEPVPIRPELPALWIYTKRRDRSIGKRKLLLFTSIHAIEPLDDRAPWL
jgi:hypothetical protein